MKMKLCHVLVATLLAASSAAHAGFESIFGAVKDVATAATVSEKDIIDASRQMVEHQDTQEKVAPAGSKHAKRLLMLTKAHTGEDNLKLNFKVYMSPEVNAFATPDGSIRIYSGLMDLMTDDELRGVIGHEIGHVKLGHSLAAMKTAYMASAARKVAGNASGTIGQLANSELGGMFEAVLNAQFSQSQETASDDYGFKFMQKHKYDVKAMESAFRKLAKQESGGASVMASHPDSASRAERMKQQAAGL